MTEQLTACGARGPYTETKRTKSRTSYKDVCCNRPEGHEGNHAHSTDRFARVWEWAQDNTKVRPV